MRCFEGPLSPLPKFDLDATTINAWTTLSTVNVHCHSTGLLHALAAHSTITSLTLKPSPFLDHDPTDIQHDRFRGFKTLRHLNVSLIDRQGLKAATSIISLLDNSPIETVRIMTDGDPTDVESINGILFLLGIYAQSDKVTAIELTDYYDIQLYLDEDVDPPFGRNVDEFPDIKDLEIATLQQFHNLTELVIHTQSPFDVNVTMLKRIALHSPNIRKLHLRDISAATPTMVEGTLPLKDIMEVD